MNKKIRLLGIFVAIFVILSGCGNGDDTDSNHLTTIDELSKNISSKTYNDEYYEVTDNGNLKLSFNEATAGICIDINGDKWYSNPTDVSNDSYASGYIQDQMLSQIVLYYYNESSELKTLSTYADSVKKQQYRTEKIDDGIRVFYTMGSFERGIEDIPQKISMERMNEKFLENEALSSSEQKWIKKRYLQKDETWSWKTNDSKMVIERMLELMDKAGYTDEDLEIDNKENDMKEVVSEKIAFQVCIEYRLEKDNLVVSIPLEEFKFVGKINPSKIEVLNYFGAAKDSEEGYIFVPDGSGALMKLEAAKDSSDYYSSEVYGGDKQSSEVRLPVYGLKNDSQAFWGIIESGDALATLNAYPSTIFSEYSMVYPSFVLEKSEYASLGDGEDQTEMLSFQEKMYSGDLTIRYSFLQDDHANYAGMADGLREYLKQEGVITDLPSNTELPLTLETIGSIEKIKTFLFNRYEGTAALTTYEQNKEIAEMYEAAGVKNLNLELVSWCNDGFKQNIAKKISPMSELGGKRKFESLLAWGTKENVDVSGVLDLIHFYSDNSYSIYKYGARNVDQSMNSLENKDIVTNTISEASNYYQLSSGNFLSIIDKLKKNVSKYEDMTLTVADIGCGISGDYGKNNCIDRETAKNTFVEGLSALSDSTELHIQGGNLYSLKYADTVTYAPQSSSGEASIDATIPFYSMVFHGSMCMSGKPINYVTNVDQYILQCIENGFGINACSIYGKSDEVKDTDYSYYYSAGTSDCFDLIVDAYKKVDEAVGDLAAVKITEHKIITDELRVVSYENGTKVYVNYSDEVIDIDGVQVQALSYKRINSR